MPNSYEINHTIVAFIDVLGFGNRLCSVTTSKNLLKVHKDLLELHETFDKNPSNPRIQESHEFSSKTVTSLSDAIIISINFNSDSVKLSGLFDTLVYEMACIASNQAQSVIDGFFLRGGIAYGFFHNLTSDNAILSNALVKAYKMESNKKALYPVIAIDPFLYKLIIQHPESKAYLDTHPGKDLADSFVHPCSKETIHFLDYFHIALGDCQTWYSDEDRKRRIAEASSDKKQKILNQSYARNESAFIKAHKRAIQIELNKNHTDKIMKKYLWLKDYHNRSIDNHGLPSKYKF